MSILTDDLDAIMADTLLSVPVVMGAQSTRGHFDWADVVEKDHAGFDVLVKHRLVRIRTGTLTSITNGSAITVDGVAYTIHDANVRDDGTLTDVLLA